MLEHLHPVRPEELENWPNDDHRAAVDVLVRHVTVLKDSAGFNTTASPDMFNPMYWQDAFEEVISSWAIEHPRSYFEKTFGFFKVKDPALPKGLFTGYYLPEVRGSLQQSPNFPVPVYAKPHDLVAFTPEEIQRSGMSYGRRGPHGPESFDTRQEIETGSLTGSNEITCWLADWVDAFFMHIQGSGRVLLQDGRFLHLSFAAKSGLPFVSIGKILIERGLISAKHMSMQTLRRWLADHSDQARQLMWQNKSFVFFKINHEGKPDSGPIGAAKRPLTPRRSLALDNSHWFYGMPVWLETLLPPESPAADKRFHHVMITQDTGSAIRGLARGDIFWGSGSQAEIIAGHMNSPGEMVVLLPHAVCRQLGLRQ